VSRYLESPYIYSRIGGFHIKGDKVYAIDSESGPYNHLSWRDGVRIGPLDDDRITAFVPPFEREDRVYQSTAGGRRFHVVLSEVVQARTVCRSC
jgi:hypothetical protein